MILNNTPQNEAVLSNVGEIGEFRIRNSAKAFNILSSGLYANKIKAIIRELSCNAVDSHIAAGNTDTPFEVHLPTTLEPYFSIRDFGTGLNHEQVTNIYTTYFESTKTNSNAFIGALGLGSKSPFSYTDNFTVVAIKDGTKGIYSAFINGEGVPSIAKMGEEQTNEPTGVEIKFSVNERWDFSKFADEARSVFRWFKQRPTITGQQIEITEIQYDSKDIIPGVHSIPNTSRSVAVMGNIAYPIDVPNTKENLEGVHHLLNCGLVMEFGIGELDFQASREGLSYIPQTIDAIRNKLAAVNTALAGVLAKEADAIDNLWTRSLFLHKKHTSPLWIGAVQEYVKMTAFALYDASNRYRSNHSLEVRSAELAEFNIALRGFSHHRNSKTCNAIKESMQNFNGAKNADGTTKYESYHHISVADQVFFIENDTKTGASERAKHHFRNNDVNDTYSRHVYVMEKIDRTKDMDVDGFFAAIHNPPEEQRLVASELDEKPRKAGGGMGKNISILTIEKRGGAGWRTASHDLVWRDGGKLDEFDDTKTYYYVPLSGFAAQWDKIGGYSVHHVKSIMENTKLESLNLQVYGVRKGDLPAIQSKKNWVKLETFLDTTINALASKVTLARVMQELDRHSIFDYNFEQMVPMITDDKSPAKEFIAEFSGLPKYDGIYGLREMMRLFGLTDDTEQVNKLVADYRKKLHDFDYRYPLVGKFNSYARENHISEYINLVDSVKGV